MSLAKTPFCDVLTLVTFDNTNLKKQTTPELTNLSELLDSDVYRENLSFWNRAWSPVKTPYTQMPDLPYLAQIPELLRAHGAQKVLDLGCGSGWLSIFLGREKFDVTGVDISQHAIDLGAVWAAQENLQNVTFQASDIANLPFGKGQFDAVVANSIFEHFTLDLARATMKKLSDVLVADGVFIGIFDKVGGGPGEYYKLSDDTHVYTDKGRRGMMLRYFSEEELKTLLSGWSIETMKTLESESRFVVARPNEQRQ